MLVQAIVQKNVLLGAGTILVIYWIAWENLSFSTFTWQEYCSQT